MISQSMLKFQTLLSLKLRDSVIDNENREKKICKFNILFPKMVAKNKIY